MPTKSTTLDVTLRQVIQEQDPQNHFRAFFYLEESEDARRLRRDSVRMRRAEHIERNETGLFTQLARMVRVHGVDHAVNLYRLTDGTDLIEPLNKGALFLEPGQVAGR